MKLQVSSSADYGLLLLRIATGTMMLLHGMGKLHDLLQGKTDFFDPFGIGGLASLVLVVIAEFFCSLLLILGLWTRFALIPLIISMSVAFFLFHADDEFIDKELPLIYLINFIVLLVTGPGRFTVSHFIKLCMSVYHGKSSAVSFDGTNSKYL